MNQEATHRQIAIVLEELSQEVEALARRSASIPISSSPHDHPAGDRHDRPETAFARLAADGRRPAASIEKIAIDALREDCACSDSISTCPERAARADASARSDRLPPVCLPQADAKLWEPRRWRLDFARGPAPWNVPMCNSISFPFARSAARFACCLAKGVGYELWRENPWEQRDEFTRMNPAGRTPVLHNPEREITLVDSRAICEYFEETVDKTPMINGTAANRAEIRRLVALFDENFFADVTHR
jgi:hypothetical protein